MIAREEGGWAAGGGYAQCMNKPMSPGGLPRLEGEPK